jgi:hypothetical protein
LSDDGQSFRNRIREGLPSGSYRIAMQVASILAGGRFAAELVEEVQQDDDAVPGFLR